MTSGDQTLSFDDRDENNDRTLSWTEYVSSFQRHRSWWRVLHLLSFPLWLLQKSAERYGRSRTAGALLTIQPLGIALSVIALLVATVTLALTAAEISESRVLRQEERDLRRIQLFSMAYESLERARRQDEKKSSCRKNTRSGQIAILNEMARSRTVMTFLDASGALLSTASPDQSMVTPGLEMNGASLGWAKFDRANIINADFRNAYMASAYFFDTCATGAWFDAAYLVKSSFEQAKLMYTQFGNANLSYGSMSGADLTGSNLSSANLSNADLQDTILEWANVSDTNFEGAKGMTQAQLDQGCAKAGKGPLKLPNDVRTGRQLIWQYRECKSLKERMAEQQGRLDELK